MNDHSSAMVGLAIWVCKKWFASDSSSFLVDRIKLALLYRGKRQDFCQISFGCRGKKVDLVRRGYHTNTSHCPETRRRANGWSRQGRIKALPNVAVPGYGTLRCVEPKLSPGGLRSRVACPWCFIHAPAEFCSEGRFAFLAPPGAGWEIAKALIPLREGGKMGTASLSLFRRNSTALHPPPYLS